MEFEASHGFYRHKMAPPNFKNVRSTLTEIFQSRFYVPLIPHTTSTLNFNQKKIKDSLSRRSLKYSTDPYKHEMADPYIQILNGSEIEPKQKYFYQIFRSSLYHTPRLL